MTYNIYGQGTRKLAAPVDYAQIIKEGEARVGCELIDNEAELFIITYSKSKIDKIATARKQLNRSFLSVILCLCYSILKFFTFE